jgi:glycosyltransferase involved in cell wall biosynthesis
LGYLDIVFPVIKKLEEQYSFEFVVIANKPPVSTCQSLRFIPWNIQTEIDDLLRFNIGIMPLVDDEWARGKCGFKALQYMALGIPALVSPVGINKDVVDHGINGYHCFTDEDWYKYLEMLLKDESLRSRMGNSARIKIEKNYSVASNTDNFLSLFSENT